MAAHESSCFDVVMVSTDDEEIASIATQYGAVVPFVRPQHLANDFVGLNPVIKNAVEWYDDIGQKPSEVCCIYATAPFIQSADIRRGYDLLKEKKSQYSFSATTFPSPVQRSFRINSDRRVEMFYPDLYTARSQDLEVAYHDAAQFCWGRADAWRKELPIFNSDATVIVLPRYRVQDIDTDEDWEMAEHLFQAMQTRDASIKLNEGRVSAGIEI